MSKVSLFPLGAERKRSKEDGHGEICNFYQRGGVGGIFKFVGKGKWKTKRKKGKNENKRKKKEKGIKKRKGI